MPNKTNRELLKTSKELILYIPAVFIPAFLMFLTIPIYTHYLGAEKYGTLSLITVFISLIVNFTSNWAISSVLRFLPKYKKEGKEKIFISTLVRLILILALIINSILIISIIFLRNNFSPQLFNLLLIALIQIVFVSILNSLVAFFRANRNVKIYTIFIVTNAIASVSLSFIFLNLKLGIVGIIMGGTIPPIILFLFLLKQFRQNFFLDLSKYSIKIAKESFLFGLPLALSALSVWILSSSDRFLINHFLDKNQVGIYAASSDIVKSLILIIISFTLASTPSLVHMWENNRKQTTLFLQNLNKIFILIILPLTILICLIAKPIVAVFTPQEFTSGYHIIYFSAFGIFFYGLYQLAYTGLYLRQKTWIIACNVLATAIISISLNIFLIPKYGIIGSAIASLISYFYLFISSVYLSKPYLPWKLPKLTILLKILFSSLAAVIPILFIKKINLNDPLQIIIISIIYLGTYLIILIVTKTFQPSEINLMKDKIKMVIKKILFIRP